jgi:hypothetical protein
MVYEKKKNRVSESLTKGNMQSSYQTRFERATSVSDLSNHTHVPDVDHPPPSLSTSIHTLGTLERSCVVGNQISIIF